MLCLFSIQKVNMHCAFVLCQIHIHKVRRYFVAATVHAWKAREVLNTAQKLSNMTIGNNTESPGKLLPPPPMKAGGWEPQSDPFLGRSQDFNHGQAYSRKVAG